MTRLGPIEGSHLQDLLAWPEALRDTLALDGHEAGRFARATKVTEVE